MNIGWEETWCGTECYLKNSISNWNILLIYGKISLDNLFSDYRKLSERRVYVKRTGTKVQKNRTDDEFIMLPTVDFCFKELMRNEKVRKGIIAALLGVRPEEIKETRLLPTVLRKEYEDDKYGVLDVRVEMHDGTQIDFEMQVAEFDFWKKRIVFYLSKMVTDQIHKGDDYDKIQKCIHVSILDFVHFPEDSRCYRKITFCDTKTGEVYTDVMEIHVLELGKLPPEDQNEEGIIRWMRFLNAKSRKELKEMAKQDEYFGEAYEELDRLSADEKKRLEYETRLKYKRDKYAQLHYATRIGREEGERIGREEGAKQINELHKRLIELGRIDDLKRAVEDSDYQGRLLKELKL